MLYEAADGAPFAKTISPMPPEMIRQEAQGYFDQFFTIAADHFEGAKLLRNADKPKLAAFHMHQVVENLYHCVLLVLTLYSPKSHNIRKLRRNTNGFDPRLREIWPNNTKLARQSFDRLWRAYIESRYSPHYTISLEQLDWLTERTKLFQKTVKSICLERLGDQEEDHCLPGPDISN